MPNVRARVGLPVQGQLKNWPDQAREAAEEIISRYGLPHEAKQDELRWFYNAPWRWTTVVAKGPNHVFPLPHRDVVRQAVGFKVPADKLPLIVSFNESLSYDEKAGELIAFCGSERMNRVILNLAHDLVVERKTIDEAREACERMAHFIAVGWPESYAADLMFVTTDDILDY